MNKRAIELKWHNPSPSLNQNGASLETYVVKAKKFLSTLSNDALPPFIKAMLSANQIEKLTEWVNDIKNNHDNLVILGTGGSSRGGQALCVLKRPSAKKQNGIKTFFFENLGVHSMDKMLEDLDLDRTHFLAISKSGTTAETLAQTIVCMKAFEHLNKPSEKHFTIIADKKHSPLVKIAQEKGFAFFHHDEDLGGRYSVLSIVGLAPALTLGIDIVKLLKAAKHYFDCTLSAETPDHENHALLGAALQAYYYEHENITQTVLMPYDTRLVAFSRWFQQLWAESLGKDNKGTTPALALGPIDQHSQLQLYLQGPRDKFFTIIMENTQGRGPELCSDICNKSGLEYLSNHTIGDLIDAEARATIQALQENNRPIRFMRCEKIDEATLGQLFAHYMMEAIIMAHLIGVDPYGQPAVERGKQLTRKFLLNKNI